MISVRAEIEIECADPELIIKSIEPDVGPTEKFSARLKAEKGALKLLVESKDMAGMLAGINSYMRLARTALEIQNMEG